jgi:lysozyme
MKTSNKEIIKYYEGLRLEAYLCPAGVWTIGYGHTGSDVWPGLVITKEWAEWLLDEDLKKFEAYVSGYVKVDLTQDQFDALVSFTYNVGAEAFKNSTMLKKLNAGDYEGAAKEFPRWNKSKGKVLPGLVKRAEAQRKLFLGEK